MSGAKQAYEASRKSVSGRPGSLRPAGLIEGFSLIEMIVVVIIIAILIAIAVPTYMSVVPRREISSDANTVMHLLQRARMAASNYQRPVRVLIDCTAATRLAGDREPCRMEAQVSLFDENGAVKEWRKLSVSDTQLHKATMITYLRPEKISLTKPNFANYQGFFTGFKSADGTGSRTYGVNGLDAFAADSFVVLFTPSGEAVTNCPMEMRFANKLLGEKNNFRLTVVNSTGYVRVQGCAGAECLS
ncbi:MAG: prepilin-type N-terminal cleavage/methylation domain-containing protein [Deltaproteobacteria bacterium]|jgi:prepilin-type N-terminal cleavage/methylation domain-containing protein|nr:prepilin-type N-terminal cleavage/methylation domain-containing protein [Deltaproteobacteria bacterium]